MMPRYYRHSGSGLRRCPCYEAGWQGSDSDSWAFTEAVVVILAAVVTVVFVMLRHPVLLALAVMVWMTGGAIGWW